MIYPLTQRTKPLISGKNAGHILLIVTVGCLALFAVAKAGAVTPAPDGGYPGENTAEGTNALLNLTSGIDNTAIGFDALMTTETSMENTAVGVAALGANTIGNTNTAIGYETLTRNTTGKNNTAVGGNAMLSNIGGHDNTATGLNALFSNTSGISNTANGVAALRANTIGEDNTAVGISALEQNIDGSFNTAVGASALTSNSSGGSNMAVGLNALYFNTIGSDNTASGINALLNNTTGSSNIALGFQAGSNLTTGSNNIDIGHKGVAGDAGRIRIGTAGTHKAVFFAGIYGTTITSGAQVIIGSGGKLGTIQSSARFKEAVKPMEKASEAILALKPVTFRYKHELDPEGIPQFGLVAEEVEKVNPALVARDDEGKAYTVRYEAVNAMLLNEFLKEHRKVGELEAIAAQQQKEIKELAGTLKKQASQIQKVSEQLENSKPARQLVAGNQ